ncbi:MAG: tetratricopeptide repeat protein [Cellvibrionaceae bacterium]|nr:tetratricopeptide repeat protein [Cellvibrionaceae bacterium]
MAYLEKGNRDAALRSFDKALQFDSRSSEAHLGLALVHQLNGEAQIAEAAFKKAIKGRADFSRSTVLFSYGKFLLEQNRLPEAIKYFNEVSADLSYPSRAQAFYFKGLAAVKMEDSAAAKTAFEYALNLNGGLAAPAIELAAMAFVNRNYPLAKKYLGQFAKNSRQTSRSLWLGIRLERIFGNADQEASYALALRNLYPYSQEYLEYKRLIGENK